MQTTGLESGLWLSTKWLRPECLVASYPLLKPLLGFSLDEFCCNCNFLWCSLPIKLAYLVGSWLFHLNFYICDGKKLKDLTINTNLLLWALQASFEGRHC